MVGGAHFAVTGQGVWMTASWMLVAIDFAAAARAIWECLYVMSLSIRSATIFLSESMGFSWMLMAAAMAFAIDSGESAVIFSEPAAKMMLLSRSQVIVTVATICLSSSFFWAFWILSGTSTSKFSATMNWQTSIKKIISRKTMSIMGVILKVGEPELFNGLRLYIA